MKADRRDPASISEIRSSAWNTATMPSRSSVARSIAACSSSGVPACSAASSSRARARVIGVRRSCAMAFDTWRTPSISRPIRSSMSLIVSASWSNSSPRPDTRTRRLKSPAAIAVAVAETLASVRRNRLRTTKAPASAITATTTSPHSSASASSVRSLRARLHVAADQQVVAAGQVVALHLGQRPRAGTHDRQLVPARPAWLTESRPAAQIAGDAAACPDRPADRSRRRRRSAASRSLDRDAPARAGRLRPSVPTGPARRR